jgi:hypothetical protein
LTELDQVVQRVKQLSQQLFTRTAIGATYSTKFMGKLAVSVIITIFSKGFVTKLIFDGN